MVLKLPRGGTTVLQDQWQKSVMSGKTDSETVRFDMEKPGEQKNQWKAFKTIKLLHYSELLFIVCVMFYGDK